MTLRSMIEENADMVCWCVHVLGPDDVHAAASHEEAVAHARDMNDAVFAALAFKEQPNDVLCFAYPAPWPHSEELHAKALAYADELKARGDQQ